MLVKSKPVLGPNHLILLDVKLRFLISNKFPWCFRVCHMCQNVESIISAVKFPLLDLIKVTWPFYGQLIFGLLLVAVVGVALAASSLYLSEALKGNRISRIFSFLLNIFNFTLGNFKFLLSALIFWPLFLVFQVLIQRLRPSLGMMFKVGWTMIYFYSMIYSIAILVRSFG